MNKKETEDLISLYSDRVLESVDYLDDTFINQTKTARLELIKDYIELTDYQSKLSSYDRSLFSDAENVIIEGTIRKGKHILSKFRDIVGITKKDIARANEPDKLDKEETWRDKFCAMFSLTITPKSNGYRKN